jgi:hypothetical protein
VIDKNFKAAWAAEQKNHKPNKRRSYETPLRMKERNE